jgi:hypothetical protein
MVTVGKRPFSGTSFLTNDGVLKSQVSAVRAKKHALEPRQDRSALHFSFYAFHPNLHYRI